MNTKIDLDQRIAAALGKGVPSSSIAGVLTDAKQAALVARQAYDAAKARALSPLTLMPEVAEARQHMADAEFMQDRMQEAISHLEIAIQAVLEREASERADAAYAAAIAERDAVAEDLKEYLPLAQRLADLLARLEASKRQMGAAGQGRADSRSAEEVVFPVDDYGGRVSLLDQVILPQPRSNVLIWPPRYRTATHRFMFG